MKRNRIIGGLLLIVPFALALLISSCNNSNEKGRWEALNSGTFTALCDESLYEFLQPAFRSYDSMYKDIDQTIIKTDARRAMAELLAGNSKVIILGRDYLPDEDSLMKKMNVKRERMKFAEDALVFFTRKDTKLDSLTDTQIRKVLTDKNARLSDYYTRLGEEPEIAINKVTSSEYANLVNLVLGRKFPVRRLHCLEDYHKVIDYVKSNPNKIGIGYLSYLLKDTSLKLLRISFMKDTSYIFPHAVHQANIVRRLYPYVVEHYVYLLDNTQDRIYWFAMFLSREAVVQRYFMTAGIVPAYAKIKLVEEE